MFTKLIVNYSFYFYLFILNIFYYKFYKFIIIIFNKFILFTKCTRNSSESRDSKYIQIGVNIRANATTLPRRMKLRHVSSPHWILSETSLPKQFIHLFIIFW